MIDDSQVGLPATLPVTAEGRRLVERLLQSRRELAGVIVADVKHDIVDYWNLGSLAMSGDVLETALLTVTDLLESLLDDNPGASPHLANIQRSASRRVHQGVSLTSLLQSYRIWGARVWQAVLDEAGEDPVKREAALGLVSRIFEYVDTVSITLAQVYMEESSGAYRNRDVLRSDLLESLLLGQVLSDRARLEIARLDLTSDYKVAVVAIKPVELPPSQARAETIKILHACRTHMTEQTRALFGIRDGDVICLVRVGNDLKMRSLVAAANLVAKQSPQWQVSVGRPHDGVVGIGRSFREAQEAAAVASSLRPRGCAVVFSDVILDRILVRSDYAGDLLEEALGPLLAYDTKYNADLIATLRSYVSHDMNMTQTAKDLLVNPNTVAYRMKRISQLTNQDPTTTAGIVTLAVALRLIDS